MTRSEDARPGYNVDGTVAVTQHWVGRPVQHALPFPYSPTMLYVLGPLCLIPLYWSYVAWTAIGFALVYWMTRPGRSPLVVGPLVFLSPLGMACFQLGQMAFASSAALLFLGLRSTRRNGPASIWPEAAVLWLLTAKPNLALTAGAALLACGRIRTVALAVGLTVVSTLLVTPWLGPNWITEYLGLITHYNREQLPTAFTWAANPQDMANLRALLHTDLSVGDALAGKISTLLWLASLLGVAVAGAIGRLNCFSLWALVIVAHLLLCPHVNSYEELHLYLVSAFLFADASANPRLRTIAVVLIPCLMWCSPAFGPLRGLRWLPVLFTGKLLLAWLIWAQSRWPHTTPSDNSIC